jgi:hypothetical protein
LLFFHLLRCCFFNKILLSLISFKKSILTKDFIIFLKKCAHLVTFLKKCANLVTFLKKCANFITFLKKCAHLVTFLKKRANFITFLKKWANLVTYTTTNLVIFINNYAIFLNMWINFAFLKKIRAFLTIRLFRQNLITCKNLFKKCLKNWLFFLSKNGFFLNFFLYFRLFLGDYFTLKNAVLIKKL